MVTRKHANRTGLLEGEFRDLSEKIVKATRLYPDLEFRIHDQVKNRFVRSDRLVKFNSSIFDDVKKAVRKNNKLSISNLIIDTITPSFSLDLKARKWKVVLFDSRSGSTVEGGKGVCSLQRPMPKIPANRLSNDERYEINETQDIAQSQITEAEHLAWEPEKTVCQGYIQALVARYGYEQVVAAVKSAKNELRN